MSPKGPSRQNFGKRSRTLLSLLCLFKMSGGKGELVTNTNALAQMLGVSQQTGSNLLRELASEGLVVRHMSREGERVMLTPKAYALLAQEFSGVSVDELSGKAEAMTLRIKGRVFTGKGEGAYYMSQKGYSEQIKKKLGFSPYPGTLNLKLESFEELNKLILLYNTPSVVLKGFSTHERAFGDVSCYPVKVEGVSNSFLVRSDRTTYDFMTVELISDKNLRKAMNLSDGDDVTFSFSAWRTSGLSGSSR